MITMKQVLLNRLYEDTIKTEVASGAVIPMLSEVRAKSAQKLDNLFDPTSIPAVGYKTDSSAKLYNEEVDKIKMLISLSTSALNDSIAQHLKISKNYQRICTRIFNEFGSFKKVLDGLLNYSCREVSVFQSSQSASSTASVIGKYVVLPYFLNSVKVYSGAVFMSMATDGSIAFSNLDTVRALPIKEPISIKIAGTEREINTSINIGLNEVSSNLFYLRFVNNIQSAMVRFYSGTQEVYSEEVNSPEMLLNYNKIKFDAITINVRMINTNPAKPFAIQIDKMHIFENILFARDGVFESKPMNVGEANMLSSVALKYTSRLDAAKTNINTMLSVSTSEDAISFNSIDQGYRIDISTYKYKYAKIIDGFNVKLETASIGGDLVMYKLPLNTSQLMNMDYRAAAIFYGLNRSYATNSGDISHLNDPFENWTKIGNYYKTSIVNYEENIWVDIDKKECKINGKTVSGRVAIPVGVSVIEVHEKDVDPTFGTDNGDSYNAIANEANVLSDPLYPLNLLYVFAGLPDYGTSGELDQTMESRTYYVSGMSNISLGESFIPLSLEVFDSKGHRYDLQMAQSPSVKGSYTIEPNRGRVKILSDASDTVTIRYRRANSGIKPCGILFNRLLTFIPLKALMGLSKDEVSTFFSIDEQDGSRFLLIPQTSDSNITHAQVSFNNKLDSIYTVVRLEMQTSDKELTPIVSSIFIEGK